MCCTITKYKAAPVQERPLIWRMTMGYCSWVDAGLARLTERLEEVHFWPLSPHGEAELMMMLMMMVNIIFIGWLVGGNRPLARDIVLYP